MQVKEKIKVDILSRIYIWVLCLYPILSMYKGIIIPQVDLATVCFLIIALLYIVFNLRVKYGVQKPQTFLYQKSLRFIALFICVIILSLLMAFVFPGKIYVPDEQGYSIMIFRCLKFLFVVIINLIIGRDCFNFQYAICVLKKITMVAASYVFLQTLSYYLLKTILPPFIKDLTIQDYNYLLEYSSYQGFFRPTSFFYEPAHYSEFAILYLMYSVYSNHISNKHKIRSVFITGSIVLSTSGIGILCCAFIWVCGAIKTVYKKESGRNLYYVLFLSAVLALPIILYFVPAAYKTFIRLFSTEYGGNNAFSIRFFSGYSVYAESSIIHKLFGMGFGYYPTGYANSNALLLISTGLAGCLVFWIFVFTSIRYGNGFSRFLMISTILLFISPILHTFFVFYLPFALFYKRQSETTVSDTKRYSTVLIGAR